MTIYFAGGEMGAFVPSDSNAIESSTTSTHYDANFTRGYLSVTSFATYADTPEFAELTDCWLHFEIAQATIISDATQCNVIEFLDSTDTAVYRLQCAPSHDTWQLQYYNGSWVTSGSTWTALSGSLQIIDIRLVSDSATGTAAAYFSGTRRNGSGTIDTSSINGVAKIRFWGKTISIPAYSHITQVIVADEPTIGFKLGTLPVNGAGAVNTFAGAYSDVDELIYSDADYITSDTANQIAMFTHGTPALTDYTVRAIAVTARAKCGATGPQNLQAGIRVGSTNYFGTTKALDVGYGAFCQIWETNPATTDPFLDSELSTLQYGVKSIA